MLSLAKSVLNQTILFKLDIKRFLQFYINILHLIYINCILTHRYSSINTIDTLFEPRKFIVLKINFGADCYWNLVDIDTTLITEPPLNTLVSDQDLQSAIDKALIFPPYPCHSQAVERWVKEVTQASQKRYG